MRGYTINQIFIMKFFKFLTIASIGLISLGLTSCSDDDDAPAENQPEELTVKKRLKSMTIISNYVNWIPIEAGKVTCTTLLSDFTYDRDGKILSYNESNKLESADDDTTTDTFSQTISYNYSDNKINDYVLANGLINSIDNSYFTYSYTYDNNRLTRYYQSSLGGSTSTFEWETGVKRILYKENGSNSMEHDIAYTYINKTCPSAMIYYNVEYSPYDEGNIDPMLADAGYYGEKLTTKLLSEYSFKENNVRVCGSTFSYEFDNDGYVTSMTVIGTGTRAGQDYKYTYVWE